MAPQTIEELLDEFALEVSLKSQPKTAVIYRRDISQLLKNVHVQLPEPLVTREHYEALVQETKNSFEGALETKEKISTTMRRRASLVRFMGYLQERGNISHPLILSSKKSEKKIFPIKREDFFLMMSHLSCMSWDGTRNRSMLALSYYAGLTTTEIAGIRYEDFEREGGINALKVAQTQPQERRLEINQHLAQELERYERIYGSVIEELTKQPALPYFKSRLEERLGERMLRKIFVRTRNEAGLSPDLDWYSLRYSFALDLMREKHATPKVLANLLGLSLISAKEFYTKLERYSQSDGKREDGKNP